MKLLIDFIKIYLGSIKIILIFPILVVLVTLFYEFVINKKDIDKKFVEARYTWNVIKIQNENYTGQKYLIIDQGVTTPTSIKNHISRYIKTFLGQARENNCNISIHDWYQGQFEILVDDSEGLISINFNNFDTRKLDNCKNFAYDYILDLNLVVVDQIILMKKQKLSKKILHRDQISKKLFSKIKDFKELMKINSVTLDVEKEGIADLASAHAKLVDDIDAEIYELQEEVKSYSSIPRELNLVDYYFKESQKSQNIIISVITSYIVGLIISILIVSILKARQISILLK